MSRLATALVVLALASSAKAGQLHIDTFGLKEVHAEGDTVVAGKVVAARGEGRKREIDVAIEQVWSGTNRGDAGVGQTKAYRIYGGVEWTDPRKSPIERRLRDGKRSATVGERVVVVPSTSGVELLPASEEVLRRLEILWAADPAARAGKESDAALQAALSDPDLAELASAVLARRGRLDVRALLKGDRAFLDARYRAMPLAEQRRFLKEGLEAVRKEPALRERLSAVVLRQPVRALVPELAPLVALYKFKVKVDERVLDDFRVELLGLVDDRAPLDLSAYVDFLYGTVLYRPSHRSSDEDFEKLTARLDRPAQARLAALLVGGCKQGRLDGPDDTLDDWLLWEGVRLAGAAPSPQLVPLLSTLDPMKARVTSQKQAIMDAMLKIAISVGRAHPAEQAHLRDAIEPWLEQRTPADQALVDEYRKLVGGGKTEPPREVTLQLAPGQRQRLPSGWRVSFAKADGGFELELAHFEGSEARTLEAREDWDREWWMPPFLVLTRRLSNNTLSVHLVPQAQEPKAAESPELYERAKAIAARKGCHDEDTIELDAYKGLFRYKAKGKGGKVCTLVIGAHTRKILRETP